MRPGRPYRRSRKRREGPRYSVPDVDAVAGDGRTDSPHDRDAGGRTAAAGGADGHGRAADPDAERDAELFGELQGGGGSALAAGFGLAQHGERDGRVGEADAEAAERPAEEPDGHRH